MDSQLNQVSKYRHDSSLPAASSGSCLYTARPRSTAAAESTDALLYLAGPAGWLIRLAAFLGERAASVILSLVFPVAALVGELRAVPWVITSNIRRAAFGLLAAACTFAVLVSALFVSALLGFVLVRHWVEEPVTVRQPLYFDYTEVQPSAAVALGGGARGVVLPAGHTVKVTLALLLPDSYHNREVGMFQIKAEAVSVTGLTTATATQPYMLRYKSAPVRLAQSALMCVPLTLGIRSETQTANLKVLQYREGHGRHKRTGLIRILLQPKAMTVQPQVYKAEVVVQSTLPWTKGLARSLKWTLFVWVSSSVFVVLVALAICLVRPLAVSANRRLLELQADRKSVPDLGRGDLIESPSKELSGSDTTKRRERRNKRKGQFETQSHGDRMELEFSQDSTSAAAMVKAAEVTE
ncbi:hypothetical protein EJB05_02274, partial [Eragrostis curvula]